jgi:hypothetical protein
VKRFLLWLQVVAFFTSVGTALGFLFGRAIYRISYEYIMVPSDFTRLGFHLGLLCGTVLAAFAATGPKPPAAFRRVLLVGFITTGTSLAVSTALGALFSVVLYRAGLLPTSTWRMAFPQRHTVCLGLQYGALTGSFLAIALAATIIARHRLRQRHPQIVQPATVASNG